MWWRTSLLAGLLAVASVSAHVPVFGQAGDSPSDAIRVQDPGKSWVYYGELRAGEQNWFVFELSAGQSLYTSLQIPPTESGRPELWIVGPGLGPEKPPGTPAGLGAIQAPSQDVVSVEPFSPLAMRSLAQWEDKVHAGGTYYLVVTSDRPTSYSVGIGLRESFTPVEWATVPVDRIAIQKWGGVWWPLAILGEAVGMLGAVVWALQRHETARSTFGFAGAGAIAGSGLTVALLAIIAVAKAGLTASTIIPFVFVLAALGIGYGAYRTVRQAMPWWQGIAWAIAGVVAWAGLLIGPVLLLVWSAWMSRGEERVRRHDEVVHD